jgi:hypothetical protein
MNQRVTVALIAGASGKAVQKLVRRWKNQRLPDAADSKSWISPINVQREVRAFTRTLHRHAEYPPVLFYRQYVDQWSMGDVFDLVDRGPFATAVQLGDSELYAYSLPDRGTLSKQFGAARRPSAKSIGRTEKIWFIDAIRDAIRTSQARKYTSILIVVREVVGGLIDEHDVSTAMADTVDWLEPFVTNLRQAAQ